jgi:hypothetical protein
MKNNTKLLFKITEKSRENAEPLCFSPSGYLQATHTLRAMPNASGSLLLSNNC